MTDVKIFTLLNNNINVIADYIISPHLLMSAYPQHFYSTGQECQIKSKIPIS